jgi:D-lactate dehydrogenase
MVAVCARAGLPVWVPDDVVGNGCGLPWSSKGFGAAHRHKANEMVARVWKWSGECALPIVIDAASCTNTTIAPGADVLTEDKRRAPRRARDCRLGQLGQRPPPALA